jgi:hypothetical protein
MPHVQKFLKCTQFCLRTFFGLAISSCRELNQTDWFSLMLSTSLALITISYHFLYFLFTAHMSRPLIIKSLVMGFSMTYDFGSVVGSVWNFVANIHSIDLFVLLMEEFIILVKNPGSLGAF